MREQSALQRPDLSGAFPGEATRLPTSGFAAPDDWGSAELGERVGRAATEAAGGRTD